MWTGFRGDAASFVSAASVDVEDFGIVDDIVTGSTSGILGARRRREECRCQGAELCFRI
jgi:hypothetical protein